MILLISQIKMREICSISEKKPDYTQNLKDLAYKSLRVEGRAPSLTKQISVGKLTTLSETKETMIEQLSKK